MEAHGTTQDELWVNIDPKVSSVDQRIVLVRVAVARYYSRMPSFYEVMIERNFSSAHQLRGYKGKCENLHGHNYRVEIYARGEELNNIGLLIDFGDLKTAADEIVKYLDHRNINELPPFDELQPSAENLAKYVLERVAQRVGDERVQIYKVRCFETPTSVATYQVD